MGVFKKNDVSAIRFQMRFWQRLKLEGELHSPNEWFPCTSPLSAFKKTLGLDF
jgi:hypothetical protein